MSEEQAGTLNTESAGESSQPVATHQQEDLVSTVDQPVPEAEPEKDASPEEAQKTEGKPDGGKETEAEGEVPFHEHPRFQELIREKNALKEQLAEVAEKQEAPDKTAEEPDYTDLGALDTEKLQDMMDEDPKGLFANLAKQIRTEVTGELTTLFEQQQREQSFLTEFEKFATANPDFNDKWESGEIQTYMDKHPYVTDARAAYEILSAQGSAAQAAKDAEAKIMKNLKAKSLSKSIGAGPAATGRPAGQTPVELKDTKPYGGLTAVLAQRSAQRMKGVA